MTRRSSDDFWHGYGVDAQIAQALYERYAGSVAFIEVLSERGDLELGSAFHIGDGLFATARHVVDANIQRIETTEASSETFRSLLDVDRVESLSEPSAASHVPEPLLHPDDDVDVAVLDVQGIAAPAVPLTGHDTEPGSRVALEPVLVFGYPWIPQSAQRPLVAATCEVSAEIDTLDGQRALVLSATARRGMSGGPVIAQSGSLRGLLIRSLVEQEGDQPEPAHRGLLAALKPEAIFECLDHHGLRHRVAVPH
jgi:Trypsin-like peptidase domain